MQYRTLVMIRRDATMYERRRIAFCRDSKPPIITHYRSTTDGSYRPRILAGILKLFHEDRDDSHIYVDTVIYPIV